MTVLLNLKLRGDATIVGLNPVSAEAGIATILVRAGINAGKIKISVMGKDLKASEW